MKPSNNHHAKTTPTPTTATPVPNQGELEAKMKRFRLIGVALLAVFALGAIAASGAQAEEAPFFSIGGTRLASGKTHNIAAHGIKPFELTVAALGDNITCEKLTVEKGVLLGSNAGTQGKADQTSKFSGCKLAEGNGASAGCHLAATEGGAVTETITTNPLHGELVENVEGKKLEELYTPATGSVFVTIFFGPSKPPCEVLSTKVTGSTAAEVVKDPGEESIELPGPTPEETSFITRFPATAITEVCLVSGGTGKIVEVGQVAFSHPSVQLGTALVLLANSKFEPETTAKWSPLP